MAEEDYDLDALNSAFAQMRSTAGGHVKPPGLAAARATIARRRNRRIATLAAAAVALIVIPVATLANTAPDVARPVPSATTTATPSPEASPAESPTPTPSAAVSSAPAGAGAGSGSGGNLAYTAIWYTGPIGGVRVTLPTGHAFAVPVGIKVWSRNSTKVGPVTNAKLAIDLSQITSKVDVVGVTGPCAVAGSGVQCDFGTLATGDHMVSLRLQARPGAAAGEVGDVNLTASGNEASWHSKQTQGKISVGSFYEATDYTVKATMNSGRVGDTLTFAGTVTNRGPTLGTYMEILPAIRSGVELAGMSANCVPAQLASGCRLENIAVGASVAFEIYLRITSCAINTSYVGTGITYMPYDPVTYDPSNSNPQFRINGC